MKSNTVSKYWWHAYKCWFKIVNKCKISKFARFKFKDFSRIFKYFQAPYLFSSTFKGHEVFIPNSSIFKDFSSMLWILLVTVTVHWCFTTILVNGLNNTCFIDHFTDPCRAISCMCVWRITVIGWQQHCYVLNATSSNKYQLLLIDLCKKIVL